MAVAILDRDGKVVANRSDGSLSGQLTINNVQLWWPYTESLADYTYRYTMKVQSCCKQLLRV